MKTRKILAAAMAGLCAVSTMGVSAFATVVPEKIETSGAKSYKVSAGFQAPTIDVTVPESVLGVINPYKIPVVIEGETFESEGVASPKYAITNNSGEVGINVKATFSAEGLDGIVATEDEAIKTDAANNKDKKKLAYVTLNATTPMEIETADGTTVAAGDDNLLVFSADATKPEKTDVLMKLNKKATGATDNAGEFWIGGAVIEEPAEKWTTSDKLSINVVLDINPFNTGATNPGTNFTDPTDLTGALTAGTGVSELTRTGDTSYTAKISKAAVGTATEITSVLNIPLAGSNQVESANSSDTTKINKNGTKIMVTAGANAGDTATVTIQLSTDGMSTDGSAITVAFTIVA